MKGDWDKPDGEICMGLDQYLYSVKYLSKYRENEDLGKTQIVKTEEIYWRKSNQIHNWFVNNVQNGTDDCGFYEVSEDQLIDLKNTCQKVLDNPKLAEKLLPTQSGFFFGSTEYDEYYWHDIKYTIQEIDKLLKLDEQESFSWFEYHSSW